MLGSDYVDVVNKHANWIGHEKQMCGWTKCIVLTKYLMSECLDADKISLVLLYKMWKIEILNVDTFEINNSSVI